MSEEVHITSLVVHAQPQRAAQVSDFIAGLPLAQVHASDPAGKLVVTLEAGSAGAILDQVSLIQRHAGVLNATLVYQHAEALESMNEEIAHVEHPT